MMARTVRPVVTVHEIISRPEYAAGKLEASTQAANDYSAAGYGMASVMALWLIASRVIKHAAGPYGGIIDAVSGIFKTNKTKTVAADMEGREIVYPDDSNKSHSRAVRHAIDPPDT